MNTLYIEFEVLRTLIIVIDKKIINNLDRKKNL